MGELRTLSLAAGPDRAGAARSWVRECCRGWCSAEVGHDVVLAASELVSNAIIHGSDPCLLSLSEDGGRLLLQVFDAGHHWRPRTGDDEHGRGLVIVERLSRAWGVQTDSAGHTVWAEFDCPPASPARDGFGSSSSPGSG